MEYIISQETNVINFISLILVRISSTSLSDVCTFYFENSKFQ